MRNRLFVILFVTVALILGIFVLVIKEKPATSILENRSLAQLTPFSAASWLDGTFQSSVENTMADHFIGRDHWVRQYNMMQISLNTFMNKGMNWLSLANVSSPSNPNTQDANPTVGNQTGESTTDGTGNSSESENQPTGTSSPENKPSDDIMTFLQDLDDPKEAFNQSAQVNISPLTNQLNLLQIDNQKMLVKTSKIFDQKALDTTSQSIQFINQLKLDTSFDISAFFVQTPQESHLVYPTNNINSILPVIDQLDVPYDYLAINRPSDLLDNYYRTDHHWNHIGSYKGYRQIIKLLFGDEEAIKVPNQIVYFNSLEFYGSLFRLSGNAADIKPDILTYLEFSLPNYQIEIDGASEAQYGNLQDYLDDDAPNAIGFDHYNNLYENRQALITFETENSDADTLLVICDSMSNAIKPLIASHFHRTHFVDLELMKKLDPHFEVEEYMEDEDLDRVLFFLSFDNLMPGGSMQYAK